MNETPVKILLIEDDVFQVTIVRSLLNKTGTFRFELTHEDRLSTGLKRLHSNDFNVILLDLVLPDSSGLATFTRTYRKAPEVPIVVLSGNDDETIAFNAVQQGAQDYLVKSQLKAGMLARALLFATQKALSGSDSLDLEEYVLGLDAIVRSGESEETQRDQALTATNNLRSILNDMLPTP